MANIYSDEDFYLVLFFHSWTDFHLCDWLIKSCLLWFVLFFFFFFILLHVPAAPYNSPQFENLA